MLLALKDILSVAAGDILCLLGPRAAQDALVNSSWAWMHPSGTVRTQAKGPSLAHIGFMPRRRAHEDVTEKTFASSRRSTA
ncbi:MAG: hypothetical protein ACLSGS_12705 [Adlercreutzia sp.]